MQIKKVFDVTGPNGVVPNGWNYNFTNDLWDTNFIITHNSIESFNKNYTQVPVYECNLNISTHNIKNLNISDIGYNINTNLNYYDGDDKLFVYPIHPFGSLDTCLGNNLNYHENTHCFDFISTTSLKYIQKSKNFYLVLDYSSEGDIKSDMFENLHKKCNELNINPKKVLIITSAMNTRDVYFEYLKNNPQENQFYTAYYCWPFLPKKGETRTMLEHKGMFYFNGHTTKNKLMSQYDFLNSKNRQYKSLILNRRNAPHRLILLSLLLNSNLLKDVNYSIDLSLAYFNIGLELANGTGYNGKRYLKNDKIRSDATNGFFKLNKIKKRTVDFDDINSVWGFGFEKKENYLNSYFSVITETIFYETGHYISEKSFKGIQHLHPFVIVGKPGILKYLKSKGFKTFSDFWDESYDTIEDDSDRMEVLYKLIESLLNKSNEEWDSLNEKLLPILIHNRETLLKIDERELNETYINNLYNLFQNEPNQENYFLF
jgi:hypothetical protein